MEGSTKKTRDFPAAIGLRHRAWWVIRKNKVVTLPELLLSLNDGSQKGAHSNLGRYLRRLWMAGILLRERTDDGKAKSRGTYAYRLKTDLGSKAPVIRTHGVYDPNSQCVFGLERP